MRSALAALALLVLRPVAPAPPAQTPAPPPATPVRPVTDVLHGVAVRDDYRWLEDGTAPAVRAWSEAQNAHARAVLDALPDMAAIRADVTAMRKLEVVTRTGLRLAGGRLFALRSQPPRQQPMLVVMPASGDVAAERTVLDPVALDAKGGVVIDWFVPSPDGAKVAVSLSRQGSELGDLHVYEVSTGRELPDVVGRVNGGTAGGSAAWDADGGGIYYTRYPRAGERPPVDLDFYTQVWHHRLGTAAAQDRYEIGRDFPRIGEIALRRSGDGRWLLANVENGDGGEYAQFLRDPDGHWTQIGTFADRVTTVAFGRDAVYGVSLRDAPRGRVLGLALPARGAPQSWSQARVVVPEGAPAIESDVLTESLVTTASSLLVRDEVGGPEQVRVFDLDGHPRGLLPLPPVASVSDVATSSDSDVVFYASETFVEPHTVWQASAAHPEAPAVRTALSEPFPVDFSDVEVVRDVAVSKDGTRVPMTILRRKGAPLDHRAPTVLTGYGGFAISEQPYFSPTRRIWFDHGGVMAIANTRGGGEMGEDWHQAGRLTHKQNVFDDFIACAERLVAAGYTSTARLAIQGGSNGGLLMGAALTQRPELFRAVVSVAGIYDMLRTELSANGQFNITEYGTVADAEQFRALHAYSPYHHVGEDVRYPAAMFMTGAHDPRVDPMQSRKMVARLQAVTGGKADILLRTSGTSGHGMGTALDEAIAQSVDVFGFLFHELGVPYGPPKAPVVAPEPQHP